MLCLFLQRASNVGGLISKEAASSSESVNIFDPGIAVPDKLPEIHIPVEESETSNTGLVNTRPGPGWKLTNIKSALSSIKLPGRKVYMNIVCKRHSCSPQC